MPTTHELITIKLIMMLKKYLLLILSTTAISTSFSQMTATFSKTINTICDGSGCDYTGPSILINEIMVAPVGDLDGSISGYANAGVPPLVPPTEGKGEWIELYNPNLCESVDISCYYLGNSTVEPTGITGGGFQLPQGTVVPPAGFYVVRGAFAAAVPNNLLVQNGGNVVEVIVPATINTSGVCVGSGGTRLWFPNAGGWFFFL